MMVSNAFLSQTYFQHSKNDYIYTVKKISEAMRQVLLPIMNDIKDDLNSVKGELTSLNETVSHLSGDFEQHKNQTTSVSEELREIECNNAAVYTCGGTGGWRRAVYLDMTDPNTNCPEEWNMTDYSKRTCGRATIEYLSCDSVTFPVSGEYSQMCGRIRAYQWEHVNGFSGYFYGTNGRNRQTTVDSAYFTGVAVMHGSPRQHIWTFAAGLAENFTRSPGPWLCPCDTTRNIPIPPFVGEDYFCESGYIDTVGRLHQFHPNDTLWDGRDCHSSSTCCSLHNPPYFTKTLNTPTTDDIELRMCNLLRTSNVAVELAEVYVK